MSLHRIRIDAVDDDDDDGNLWQIELNFAYEYTHTHTEYRPILIFAPSCVRVDTLQSISDYTTYLPRTTDTRNLPKKKKRERKSVQICSSTKKIGVIDAGHRLPMKTETRYPYTQRTLHNIHGAALTANIPTHCEWNVCPCSIGRREWGVK